MLSGVKRLLCLRWTVKLLCAVLLLLVAGTSRGANTGTGPGVYPAV